MGIKEEFEESNLKLMRTMISNTIAVFTNSPEHRNIWRKDLVEARNKQWPMEQFLPVADRGMIAFIDAVIGLLDANGNPLGLGDHLTGEYKKAWQALIVTLAMRRDTP
jgi:hypothetical protein